MGAVNMPCSIGCWRCRNESTISMEIGSCNGIGEAQKKYGWQRDKNIISSTL